jgi:hypothetical protein
MTPRGCGDEERQMAGERFSYQVVTVKPRVFSERQAEDIQAELNRLGAQGWELVAVQATGAGTRLYLKRAH